MNKEYLWVMVYFVGVALWFFVVFASLTLFIDPSTLLDVRLDLTVPMVVMFAFYLSYPVMSAFLYIVYLTNDNRLERNQFNIKSQFSTWKPLCSIIIPARNEENVIRNSVKSCLKQTYRNIEIIVICHNSNDRTFENAHDDDSRVRVFDLETKQTGKSVALNYGLDNARGEYILVVDADGSMADDFIENALPIFSNGCVAVQGRIRCGNRNYNFVTKMLSMEDDLWYAPNYTFRQFFGDKCPLGGTGCIIKKDILIKVGKFKNHLVDDAELTHRLFKEKYRISYAPLSVVYGEEPPALNIMIRQRARWAAGFLHLFIHGPADRSDILDCAYWLLPVSAYAGLVIFGIIAYATIYHFIFGYSPYSFYYLPIIVWFLTIGINFLLSMLVLMKQHGLTGIRYVLYLPIFMVFSQYSLATLSRAFFIKSWGNTKTVHGFTQKIKVKDQN
jgi:cellulose synthase/poly-beta-1,6-N-acetylglucosamine synthase-like glycosyltransferase